MYNMLGMYYKRELYKIKNSKKNIIDLINHFSKEFYNKYFLINDIVVDGNSINTLFKKNK